MTVRTQEYIIFKQNIENYFKTKTSVTSDELSAAINIFKPAFPDVDTTLLYTELLSEIDRRQDPFRIIEAANDHEKWLQKRKATIEWKFWERYERYLLTHLNFKPTTVHEINTLTDEIIDRLGNPLSPNAFDQRGLVVGNVQSGKTSNFIGLINKAVDSGYKLIIVLAGIHNSLRSQTQLRIDEGVRGRDSKISRAIKNESKNIGVGEIDSSFLAHSLTSSEGIGDFDRNSYLSNNVELGGKDPIVAVVKKHKDILNNLINWLQAKGASNIPVLVIDDEADNASINTARRKDEISTINKLIRKLLKQFKQKSFIGFTATPFANVFIRDEEDEEYGPDLFPKDFIVNIPPPLNYVGAKQFFGLEVEVNDDEYYTLPDEMLVRISDYATAFPPKHKKDDPKPEKVEDLPDSLLKAIKYFILVCAVRYARGQDKKHNSMLIHVSHLVKWQKALKTLVGTALDDYKKQIEFNTDGRLVTELQEIYTTQFIPVTKDIKENFKAYNDPEIRTVPWEKVKESLFISSKKIKVFEVHGESKDVLEYKDYETEGASLIAVGGNKLSRGLTLEGLSISYYLRTAKTYDTLMQMGRWFGYRPGYLDLCRLFTSVDLIEDFKYVTLASEELRADFDTLWENDGKPLDFGLRVLTHDSGLQVTAANKRVDSEKGEINFNNRLRETYRLQATADVVERNLKATNDLLGKLGNPNIDKAPHLCWNDVPPDHIISFIDNFIIPPRISGISTHEIAKFIQAQNDVGELATWFVAIINNKTGSKTNKLSLPGEIRMTHRTHDTKNEVKKEIYVIRKNHIISKEHEWLDFGKEEYDEALRRTHDTWEKGTKKKPKPQLPSGYGIRETRKPQKGLLLLYPLDPAGYKDAEKKRGLDLNDDTPIMGFAISFPASLHNKSIAYTYRKDYLDTLLGSADSDDEND